MLYKEKEQKDAKIILEPMEPFFHGALKLISVLCNVLIKKQEK